MPFPKITDPEQIVVNGRKPGKLVQVPKPCRTDPEWAHTLRVATEHVIHGGEPGIREPAPVPADTKKSKRKKEK
jgi:hypothetical protein